MTQFISYIRDRNGNQAGSGLPGQRKFRSRATGFSTEIAADAASSQARPRPGRSCRWRFLESVLWGNSRAAPADKRFGSDPH